MRLASVIPLFLCSVLFLLAPKAGAQVAIANEKVALTGEADPYGGLLPSDLTVFRLGDDGTVLFHQDGPTASRLYSGTYAGTARRLADGARATGNRPVTDFLFTAGNEAGQIALMAYDGGLRNIYLLTGTTLKTVVVQGADAAGDGEFSFLYDPSLDTVGNMAFKADTTQSGFGIFFVGGTATPPVVNKVAVAGAAAPEGGTFTFFDYRTRVATQRDGRVVVFFNAAMTDDLGVDGAGFYAALVGGGPPTITRVANGLHTDFVANRVGQVVYVDFTAINLADVTGSTVLAQVGDAAPGGDTFSTFGDAAINDAGTVVFQATTTAGLPGLYVAAGGVVSQLAGYGTFTGAETLQGFGTPQINQNGLIAFSADVGRGGTPGTSIYLSDGTTLVRVIGTDDALAGSAIQPSALENALLLAPNSLNLHGQFAFSAKLANGKAGLFTSTPTSRLLAGGPGVWDDVATWSYRIVPGPDTPVIADSAADVVLQGPTAPVARKVRSVQVGGGTGTTTFHLQTGGTLTAPKGVTLGDHGVLSGSATIAGNLTMLAGSRLALDLAGAARPAYEFLHVTGTATLGGTLDVAKINSFEPTRGQSFDLLDLTKRVGTFAATSLPAVDPAGQTWDVTKLYTTGAIAVSGATLFAPTAGVFTGTFEGNPVAPANSGSLLLTLAPGGRLSGSIYYAGRRYIVGVTLNVDGSGTVSFGLPKKTLQVQIAMVNQVPQLTATVSTGGVAESQAVTTRANPVFPVNSPYVGHYTIALPPDPAHPEATFPQGTGYAKVTVTTRGLASVVGVLGDGTPFSAGGPLTTAGEFPFYLPAYALKGSVVGKLALHGATPADSVEGSFRWLKSTTTGKFASPIDATITVFGSGFKNPVAPAKILTFANDQAAFHAVGGNVDPLPDKTVVLGTVYAFKSTTSEPFAFTFSAATFGLGSGNFRDAANKLRTMKGVALQKQNKVAGLLIGTDQNGTFDIE
ncbi:MAG TPA: hypothetical protein VGO11_03015 [Chthoniobacteraceae bacterium]|jgi:hypothetical protein|nr:hypothetical protein [Chthoniobacteraceae bacterium]